MSEGCGRANIEHKAPQARQTTFRLGFITEPRARMTTLRLGERGRVSEHDPLL